MSRVRYHPQRKIGLSGKKGLNSVVERKYKATGKRYSRQEAGPRRSPRGKAAMTSLRGERISEGEKARAKTNHIATRGRGKGHVVMSSERSKDRL